MRHYLIKAVLGCFLLLSLAHCKKHASQPPTNYEGHAYTDSATVNAYYFKQGTYWIYEDSATGQTDSYFVTESANKIYRDYIYGMHDSHYDSASYYVSYISSVNIDGTTSEARKCKMVLDKYGINFYYYSHDSTEGPFYLSPHLFVYWPDTISYTTHANAYNNLMFVSDRAGADYLLGKHLGMVKMTLTDQNHVWELLRCHIVQ